MSLIRLGQIDPRVYTQLFARDFAVSLQQPAEAAARCSQIVQRIPEFSSDATLQGQAVAECQQDPGAFCETLMAVGRGDACAANGGAPSNGGVFPNGGSSLSTQTTQTQLEWFRTMLSDWKTWAAVAAVGVGGFLVYRLVS